MNLKSPVCIIRRRHCKVPPLLVQQFSVRTASGVFALVCELSRRFSLKCFALVCDLSRPFRFSVRPITPCSLPCASYHVLFALICELLRRFRLNVRSVMPVFALMFELSSRFRFSCLC